MNDKPVLAELPSSFGEFVIKVWPGGKGEESIALITKDIDITKPVLVRVHSECITGDVFNSLRCDCGPQKEEALKLIGSSGNGILLYLRQEGRGIGLYEKIKAYSLQDTGYDTYEANELLGHAPDEREYSWVKTILDDLHVTQIRLLTNNPVKMKEIADLGIKIIERIGLVTNSNKYNQKYLHTKRNKFNHYL